MLHTHDMIIMKFGGTSIADAAAIKRVIEIVRSRLSEKPLVVVSAISQATNILHQVGNLAAFGTSEKLSIAKKALSELKDRHLCIASELISDELLSKAISKIDTYFLEIDDVLSQIFSSKKLSAKNYARMVAYGELLSSVIVSAAFTQSGIFNVLIDARGFMITDEDCFHGEPNLVSIKRKLPQVIEKYQNQQGIIITQGFIASTEQGITTTLGREGSDYSAALIGMALQAQEIEIWTDVDGIMTADPRYVSHTKLVPTISFEEAAHLTYFGAKVLHPSTLKPARQANIPVRVLNSKNALGQGTLIVEDCHGGEGIKSIAHKENIKILHISYSNFAGGNLESILEILHRNKVSPNIISASLANLVLVCDDEIIHTNTIAELTPLSSVEIEDDKALVSLVGKDLRCRSDLIKNITKVLGSQDIIFTLCGMSKASINLIVQKKELLSALETLHGEFF